MSRFRDIIRDVEGMPPEKEEEEQPKPKKKRLTAAMVAVLWALRARCYTRIGDTAFWSPYTEVLEDCPNLEDAISPGHFCLKGLSKRVLREAIDELFKAGLLSTKEVGRTLTLTGALESIGGLIYRPTPDALTLLKSYRWDAKAQKLKKKLI